MSDELDNAAQTALWPLMNSSREKMGALFTTPQGIGQTDTVTSGNSAHVKGQLAVPAGSLAGLFHNHPLLPTDAKNRRGAGEDFSDDDKQQARRLGVPSYIQTPTQALRKYDPKTGKTDDVLAELPVGLISALRINAPGE